MLIFDALLEVLDIISDMYAYPGGLGLNTATKDQLFNMNVFPVESTNNLVHYNISAVYFPIATIATCIIFYLANATRRVLAAERIGPAFLGPAYALSFGTGSSTYDMVGPNMLTAMKSDMQKDSLENFFYF